MDSPSSPLSWLYTRISTCKPPPSSTLSPYSCKDLSAAFLYCLLLALYLSQLSSNQAYHKFLRPSGLSATVRRATNSGFHSHPLPFLHTSNHRTATVAPQHPRYEQELSAAAAGSSSPSSSPVFQFGQHLNDLTKENPSIPASFRSLAPPSEPKELHTQQQPQHPIKESRETAGGKGAKGSPPRRIKMRALVAVEPYVELTERESNETVMERFFGQRISRFFWKYKRMTSSMSWFAVIMAFVALFFALITDFSSPEALANPSRQALLIILVVLETLGAWFFVLCSMWLMNYSVFIRLVQRYETIVFLFEAFLFMFSFWSVFCFDTYSFFLAANWYLFTALLMVAYDTFPITVRKGTRIAISFGVMAIVVNIVLIYARLTPNMCPYRYKLGEGFVFEADIIEDMMWSFSMVDFCINRGISVVILIGRIVFSSFKHTQDCLVMKSRLRLVETANSRPLALPTTGKNSPLPLPRLSLPPPSPSPRSLLSPSSASSLGTPTTTTTTRQNLPIMTLATSPS